MIISRLTYNPIQYQVHTWPTWPAELKGTAPNISSPLSQLLARSDGLLEICRRLLEVAGIPSGCGGVSKPMKLLCGRDLDVWVGCCTECLRGTGEEEAEEHSLTPPNWPAVRGLGRSREDMDVVVTVIPGVLQTILLAW